MLDSFEKDLNELLVDTFRSILKVEEDTLRSTKIDLSISELHLLEAVGKNREQGRTISELAQELDITLPSVTVAINKLLKKGYVQKKKSGEDARMVYVILTKQGSKVDHAHRYFHRQMVRQVSSGFSEEEKQILARGIFKLDAFFKRKSAEMEK
ncbi:MULTISPECIES: MarR family winged helix-turn-helix transcriptional regulator [Acutalibacteraceae]|uniref:MarR family winged helix-turn-helix transcriptional regulator n=1 Tax=Acutalibacteraceae TaxID=3082771 RepID=UPI0013E8A2A6|nr:MULTISPECIES: MarR family transcriptional regulator [Acutalibacteraceae]